MVRWEQVRQAQNLLTDAAKMDFMDWWEAANRYNRSPEVLLDVLVEPFTAIVQTYGESAAFNAVDQMILNRTLFDELMYLPEPHPAEVARVEQIENSMQWALNTSRKAGVFDDEVAARKLRGVLTRLVLQPARDTVTSTIERDGSRYARIPEPNACPFCLMLASRGAVYLRDTVLGRGMKKYHDHCRCIGIEVPAGKDPYVGLPPINKQLRDLWDANVGVEAHEDWDSGYRRKQWRNLIIFKRREATGVDDSVRHPPLRGLVLPQYRRGNVFGDEPRPDVEKLAGHVLFGWMDGPLPPLDDGVAPVKRTGHTRGDREGHRTGSLRDGASIFPESWSDQRIVDEVVKTIDEPEFIHLKDGNETFRGVGRWVDGVYIHCEWQVKGEGEVYGTGYPLFGDGVKVRLEDKDFSLEGVPTSDGLSRPKTTEELAGQPQKLKKRWKSVRKTYNGRIDVNNWRDSRGI